MEIFVNKIATQKAQEPATRNSASTKQANNESSSIFDNLNANNDNINSLFEKILSHSKLATMIGANNIKKMIKAELSKNAHNQEDIKTQLQQAEEEHEAVLRQIADKIYQTKISLEDNKDDKKTPYQQTREEYKAIERQLADEIYQTKISFE